ncbi:phage tail spike protein [Streptococcus pyogenes]
MISVFPSTAYTTKELAGVGYPILDLWCKSATLYATMNGEQYIKLVIPHRAKGVKINLLPKDLDIIKIHDMNGDEDYYRVRRPVVTLKTTTIYAEHITYDLNNNFIEDIYIYNRDGQGAMDKISKGTQYDHPFILRSNIKKLSNIRLVRVNPIQALIGSADNTFLKRYGGELKRQGFTLSINNRIGVDRTDVIRTGKNLTGFECDYDFDNVVTRIMPKGPNGQKGDRGKGVESARVDEEGNLFVKFEEESEKLVGNIKGQKGDKGDSLKFEDLTSDQIAQIKAKDVDLSAYATKAELKEIDVSKQLADYLSKAEANSTYAKASHKHSLSDITDLNLDRYATKIELQNKASTYHRHRTSDIDGIDEYLKQTDLPQDIVKQSDIRDVVRNAQLSGYVRLADIQYQLNNIGKLKDVATGQYLSVRVVDKGKVPYNTSGLIVFERSGGK